MKNGVPTSYERSALNTSTANLRSVGQAPLHGRRLEATALTSQFSAPAACRVAGGDSITLCSGLMTRRLSADLRVQVTRTGFAQARRDALKFLLLD